MNFKQLFVALLVVFCFNFVIAQNTPPSTTIPGPDFERPLENTEFKEEDIKQFHIEIPPAPFDALMQTFENDTDTIYNNHRIAGFCFIPILRTPRIREDTDNPDEHPFITAGFRVVLTLWKPDIDSVGNIQPSEIRLYKFNALTDALDPTFSTLNPAPPTTAYFEVLNPQPAVGINFTTSNYDGTANPVIAKGREFDFVFLDSLSYAELATSTRWYGDGNRTAQGIVLERCINSIKDENDVEVYHRSLIFRPLPIPNIGPGAATEEALSYKYGYHCPPYWKNFSTEPLSNSLELFVEKSSLSLLEENRILSIPRPEGITDQLWFQLLALAAGMGISFFLGNRARQQ